MGAPQLKVQTRVLHDLHEIGLGLKKDFPISKVDKPGFLVGESKQTIYLFNDTQNNFTKRAIKRFT